ncbi:unnamed protein product [Haemonchus placei]|uniref:RanBD1 domain-containing protein n=1 Tax=Haemonchus placei TaxID=6290 RepID=A0A0N4W3H0_HAEPC|nr:unnamed protein product [Haemonchus placei]
MRILRNILLPFVVHFLVVYGHDETVSDVFDTPSASVETRDVVGPTDFLGQTEEINEGSDSFAISTAMVEPFTETTPAITTTKLDDYGQNFLKKINQLSGDRLKATPRSDLTVIRCRIRSSSAGNFVRKDGFGRLCYILRMKCDSPSWAINHYLVLKNPNPLVNDDLLDFGVSILGGDFALDFTKILPELQQNTM